MDLSARRRLLICVVLAALTVIAFYRVLGNEFVFDDRPYVLENKPVHDGLTGSAITWAFTSSHAANWHPVTWLSHMLDCQVFGLKPTGHHATNLLLHALNSILLFLLLTRMTGHMWRSGFVAGLFAVHPVHVESVAWVAERKDLLSMLFLLLTVWAYVRYAEFKVQGSRFKVAAYVLVTVLFALGLMAKPMLVTLPFLLLLLDYWPLGRFRGGPHPNPLPPFDTRSGERTQGSRVCGCTGEGVTNPESRIAKLSSTNKSTSTSLVIEKIPLFALSIISSAITYQVQQAAGAMGSREDLMPLGIRLSNALVSYIAYIVKMLWPVDLAVLYPHPVRGLPVWQPLGAVILLAGITWLVVRAGRPRPYMAVGWLWYVGTMVPVIGIVQVGAQAMADRYTYIPLVGLFIVLAWGIPELVKGGKEERRKGGSSILPFFHSSVLPLSAAIAVLALTACAWAQTGYWKDALTLFGHTLRATSGNYLAHNNYGAALEDAGKPDEAVPHYEAALAVRPRYLDALNNMGNALRRQKRFSEAEEMYRKALEIEPRNAKARSSLAAVLEAQGKADEAIAQYKEVAKSSPDSAAMHNDMGKALSSKGMKAEAMREWREAIRLDPKCIEAHYNLAIELSNEGKIKGAVEHYNRILEINPDHMDAHLNLGALFSDQGKHDEAIRQYLEVARIKPDYAPAHHNMAVSYFLKGDYARAWEHIKLCRKYGLEPDPRLVRDLSARMPEPR